MNSPMSCSQHIPPLLLAHLSALCVHWQQSDAFDGSQGLPTSVSSVPPWTPLPSTLKLATLSSLMQWQVSLWAMPWDTPRLSLISEGPCDLSFLVSNFETGIHSLLPFLVSATLTAHFQLRAPDSRLSSTAPQFMSQWTESSMSFVFPVAPMVPGTVGWRVTTERMRSDQHPKAEDWLRSLPGTPKQLPSCA